MREEKERTERKPRTKTGVRHLAFAMQNSLRGIRDAFRTAAAFRQECGLLVVHYVALCLVPMGVEFRLALAASGPVLLMAELLNSAIESVVDMVSPEWNLKARYAKDFGSAAVFMALVLVAALWVSVSVGVLYDIICATREGC